jgi:hypothetical protein
MKSKDALDCLDLNVLVLIGYFLGHKTEVQSSSWERAGNLYLLYRMCACYIEKNSTEDINLTKQRLEAAQDSQNDQDAAEDSHHEDKNVKGSEQLKKVGSSGKKKSYSLFCK